MKNPYSTPELTVYRFATEDVIMDRPDGSGQDPWAGLSLDDAASEEE